MPPVDLDRWVREPVVRSNHSQAASRGEDELWAAATTVRLNDCRVLGPLIHARIPGLAESLPFDELFRNDPFNLLDEGHSYTLSGLCGRIWTVQRDFAPLAGPE